MSKKDNDQHDDSVSPIDAEFGDAEKAPKGKGKAKANAEAQPSVSADVIQKTLGLFTSNHPLTLDKNEAEELASAYADVLADEIGETPAVRAIAKLLSPKTIAVVLTGKVLFTKVSLLRAMRRAQPKPDAVPGAPVPAGEQPPFPT